MEKRLVRILLIVTMTAASLTFETSTFAQAVGAPAAESKSELVGTRRQLATIIFAGLAGAIFGLSTLSFYGRPQDKLNNVAIGGALGIIAGTVYTTYKTASHPYDGYDVAESELAKPLERGPLLTFNWQF